MTLNSKIEDVYLERGIIYRITCTGNGRFYIGMSWGDKKVDSNKRKKQHLKGLRNGYHPNIYMQRSFNKYGEITFKFDVIEKHDKISRLELGKREKYFIKKFDTFKNGFNFTKGGGGIDGYRHSTETKDRISNSLRQREWVFTEELRKEYSERILGDKHHNSTVSELEVIEIIKFLEMGMPYKEIARLIDCEVHTVNNVSSGKAWCHLKEVSDYQKNKKKKIMNKPLDHKQVTELVDLLLEEKYTHEDVATIVGCGRSSVTRVAQGRAWKTHPSVIYYLKNKKRYVSDSTRDRFMQRLPKKKIIKPKKIKTLKKNKIKKEKPVYNKVVTDEKIKEIVKYLHMELSEKEIADKTSISIHTIRRINMGESWMGHPSVANFQEFKLLNIDYKQPYVLADVWEDYLSSRYTIKQIGERNRLAENSVSYLIKGHRRLKDSVFLGYL